MVVFHVKKKGGLEARDPMRAGRSRSQQSSSKS